MIVNIYRTIECLVAISPHCCPCRISGLFDRRNVRRQRSGATWNLLVQAIHKTLETHQKV